MANCEGLTPLQLALLKWSITLGKMLLDAGARADRVDDSNLTPLHYAVRFSDCKFARQCIEAGADVNVIKTNNGMTALHYALRDHHSREMVELLLKAGAEINHIDRKGFSPLHWAVYYKRLEIVKMLLESGRADVNLQDRADHTDSDDEYYDDNSRISDYELIDNDGLSALQVCQIS